MKKYILFTATLCLTIAAHAQHIEIGMNVGAALSSAPAISMYKGTGKASGYGSFKMLYNAGRHWQFGVSVSALALGYTFEPLTSRTWLDTDEPVLLPVRKMEMYYANPVIPVTVIANHRMAFQNVTLYTGVNAGYYFDGNPIAFAREFDDKQAGFIAGTQLGATWFFARHIGLNVETGIQYFSSYKVFTVPASLGLRFSL